MWHLAYKVHHGHWSSQRTRGAYEEHILPKLILKPRKHNWKKCKSSKTGCFATLVPSAWSIVSASVKFVAVTLELEKWHTEWIKMGVHCMECCTNCILTELYGHQLWILRIHNFHAHISNSDNFAISCKWKERNLKFNEGGRDRDKK
jgi:hypothetical protein